MGLVATLRTAEAREVVSGDGDLVAFVRGSRVALTEDCRRRVRAPSVAVAVRARISATPRPLRGEEALTTPGATLLRRASTLASFRRALAAEVAAHLLSERSAVIPGRARKAAGGRLATSTMGTGVPRLVTNGLVTITATVKPKAAAPYTAAMAVSAPPGFPSPSFAAIAFAAVVAARAGTAVVVVVLLRVAWASAVRTTQSAGIALPEVSLSDRSC